MQVFGIQIRAQDSGASQAFARVSQGLAQVRGAAAAATSGLGKVGAGVVIANQALEIGKKAIEALRMGYEAFVAPALEARSALDPGRQAIDGMVASANAARTAIGDALIPVIGGIATALGPTVRRVTEWATANRQAIAVGVAEWIRDTGQALERVLTPTLQIAATAVTGLRMTWVVLRDAAGQALASMLRGFGAVYAGVARVAEAVGADDLASTMRSSAAVTRQWGDELDRSSQSAAAEVAKLQRELADTRGGIGAVGAEASRVLEGIVPAAAAIAATEVKKAGAEAAATAFVAPEGMMDSIVREVRPYIQQVTRDREALEAAEDAARKRREAEVKAAIEREQAGRAAAAAETEAMYTGIAGTISNVLIGAVEAGRAAVASGASAGEAALEALKAIGLSILQIVTQVVAKLIVFTAIKAIFGAATGGVGSVVGSVFGFAQGGLVPFNAGVPGRDSVPILAQPGESVLTVRQTQALMAGGTIPPRDEGPRSRRGGGAPTIVVNAGSFVPSSRADLERTTREPMTRILAGMRMTGARSA